MISEICRSVYLRVCGTTQGGVSRAPGVDSRNRSQPEGFGVVGQYSFPQTLRSMQSFLGSLNYYSRFLEDFAIYASVLYELKEADFHEIRRLDNLEDDHAANQDHGGDIQIDDDHGHKLVGGGDKPMTRMDGHDQPNIEKSNGQRTSGHRWEKLLSRSQC